MESLFLFVVVIEYCQMDYYVFQSNVTKQTLNFMLIWILIWSAVGVVDWLRPEFYDYCDIYGLLVICVCVLWVWSIMEDVCKIEIKKKIKN